MSEYNPFSAPPAFDDPATEVAAQRVYGGIGRLAYFGLSILVGIVGVMGNVLISLVVSQAAVSQTTSIPVISMAIVGGLGLLNLIGWVTIGVLRLKNLGMNGFWVLGLFVPILNLAIAILLIAAPEGYADHKTLDTPGKLIVGIHLGLFVLVLILVAVAIGMGGP